MLTRSGGVGRAKRLSIHSRAIKRVFGRAPDRTTPSRSLRLEQLEARLALTVGFISSYELQNWSSSGITAGTTGIDPSSGASDTAEFSYNVNLGGGGVTARTAEFTTLAETTGVVSFDYEYSGFHAFNATNATFETLGDSTTTVVDESPFSSFTFTGSASIDVTAGLPFGFRIGGSNFDSDSRLIGALTISNFDWPTLIVNRTGDTDDGNLGNGITTLREAINAANSQPGRNTITFDLSAGSTIALGSELVITDSLTIQGPGADRLTIDASSADSTPGTPDGNGIRIFDIDDVPTTIDVEIVGLSLTGGDVDGDGGAIRNRENLTITGATIRDNASTDDGGAIDHSVGNLTITDSTISHNSAGDEGGGIFYTGGDLTITGGAISHNSAGDDGGGIYNIGADLTITDSTISHNSAGDEGGGIFSDTNLTGTQQTTITNSTISGNTAAFRAGGVYNIDGLTVILNSTITDNTAPEGEGSGVFSFGDRITETRIGQSIVAGNTNSDLDTGSTNSFVSLGVNLFGQGAGAGVTQFNSGPGANGHYYEIVAASGGIKWDDASAAANAAGGHLASVTSAEESDFLFTLVNDSQFWHFDLGGFNIGPHIGGFQPDGSPEPDGGWSWVTGEPFGFTNWLGPNQPDDSGGVESRIHLIASGSGRAMTWNDTNPNDNRQRAYIVEYDALAYDPSDLVGVNPLLGPLQDNGGPTLTHALLPDSPAIDAISFGVELTDQRGVPRPLNGSSDIGAFERSLDGDVTLDGRVGRPDVAAMLRDYGNRPVASFSHRELTGDDAIGLADVATLQTNLGESAVPAPTASDTPAVAPASLVDKVFRSINPSVNGRANESGDLDNARSSVRNAIAHRLRRVDREAVDRIHTHDFDATTLSAIRFDGARLRAHRATRHVEVEMEPRMDTNGHE